LINPNEIAMPLTLAAIACLTLIEPAFDRRSRWLARIGAGAGTAAASCCKPACSPQP